MDKPLLHTLQKYLPAGSAEYAHDLLWQYGIQLHIKKPRKTKLGDYRPPRLGEPHRISINNDLNPYAFLITFLHETAHLVNFEQNGFKVKPHGAEWKQCFKKVSQPVLTTELLPKEVFKAVALYLGNPSASSCTSPELVRALKVYDRNDDLHVLLETLPYGAHFLLKERLFQKGEKLRSRFRCVEIKTNKWYFVPALIEVKPQL
jgi:SprT protein